MIEDDPKRLKAGLLAARAAVQRELDRLPKEADEVEVPKGSIIDELLRSLEGGRGPIDSVSLLGHFVCSRQFELTINTKINTKATKLKKPHRLFRVSIRTYHGVRHSVEGTDLVQLIGELIGKTEDAFLTKKKEGP